MRRNNTGDVSKVSLFFFNWSSQLLQSYFYSSGRRSLRKLLNEVLHFVSFLYIRFQAFGVTCETT